MKPCQKFVVTLFSFGMMMGVACAQSDLEEKQAEQSQQLSEEDTPYIGYGRRMKHNSSYEGYCNDSDTPCSRYRRARMSHHDRQMLRQQVNEAGKTLYPRVRH